MISSPCPPSITGKEKYNGVADSVSFFKLLCSWWTKRYTEECAGLQLHKRHLQGLYIKLKDALEVCIMLSPVVEELGGTLYLQEASYTAKCEPNSNDLGSELHVPRRKAQPFYSVKFLKETGEDGSTKCATVNQHPPAHCEGWMVGGQEIVFWWVPVPQLTMVVSSVAFLFYLRNNNPQASSLVGS